MALLTKRWTVFKDKGILLILGLLHAILMVSKQKFLFNVLLVKILKMQYVETKAMF